MCLIGAAFRFEIAETFKKRLREFDALEIMVDHYLAANERQRDELRGFVGQVPLVGHGIGLSLGTFTRPDSHYLERVARALNDLNVLYYSEHLAFTNVPGIELAELLPLPRKHEVAEHVISNIQFVKSFFDIPFYLENIAYYFDYPDSELSEAEFFSLICRETNTKALLDTENLYANAVNHGNDAKGFIDSLPDEGVGAMHLAGGTWEDGRFVDDHGHPIPDETLELTKYALQKFNPEAIIVERDNDLRNGDELIRDVQRVRACVAQVKKAA